MTPDILTFAKQVTNGAQPLGGVVASKDLRHLHGRRRARVHAGVPHGYTYSAHPWPALQALRRSTSAGKKTRRGRVKALAPYFENAVHGPKGTKHVADIRSYGLAAA